MKVVPHSTSFKQKLIPWKREWQGVTSLPSTIKNALTKMSVSFYPNIAQILCLAVMVHKIDRPSTTPFGPSVLSLTFNSKFGSDKYNYLLTTSLFCTKGLEGL